MNLITDQWIPARTRDGHRKIRPSEVVDPTIVALDFPRHDFNAAIVEFLIGLLSTAYAPADEAEWRARWSDRPSVADLDAALLPLAQAFDSSTFMQCAIDGDNKPISTILIDASGDKTEKLNADCLNRRDDLALSLPDAIASLITLQTYAPQGGSGNHVSIRGGGPMTTLIVGGDDLWSTVWPNVETVEQIQSRAVGSTEFAWPWLWTRETITRTMLTR